MECGNCGFENEGGAVFCIRCGSRIVGNDYEGSDEAQMKEESGEGEGELMIPTICQVSVLRKNGMSSLKIAGLSRKWHENQIWHKKGFSDKHSKTCIVQFTNDRIYAVSLPEKKVTAISILAVPIPVRKKESASETTVDISYSEIARSKIMAENTHKGDWCSFVIETNDSYYSFFPTDHRTLDVVRNVELWEKIVGYYVSIGLQPRTTWSKVFFNISHSQFLKAVLDKFTEIGPQKDDSLNASNSEVDSAYGDSDTVPIPGINEAVLSSLKKDLSEDVAMELGIAGSGQRQKKDERIQDLKNQLEAHPDDAKKHFDLAELLHPRVHGLYPESEKRAALEAENHYERAIAIEPGNAEAHYHLAELQSMYGSRDSGVNHLRKAVELSPHNTSMILELARQLGSSDDNDEIKEAISLYQVLLGKESIDPTIRIEKARLHSKRGDLEGYAELCRSLFPTFDPAIHEIESFYLGGHGPGLYLIEKATGKRIDKKIFELKSSAQKQ